MHIIINRGGMLINMMKQIGILVLVLTVTLPGIAVAHGKGKHVLGTVAALDEAEIQVLTKEGKTVSIQTDAETKYQNRGKDGKETVPQVGDRVVVDAKEIDGKLTATEVKFSSVAKEQEP